MFVSFKPAFPTAPIGVFGRWRCRFSPAVVMLEQTSARTGICGGSGSAPQRIQPRSVHFPARTDRAQLGARVHRQRDAIVAGVGDLFWILIGSIDPPVTLVTASTGSASFAPGWDRRRRAAFCGNRRVAGVQPRAGASILKCALTRHRLPGPRRHHEATASFISCAMITPFASEAGSARGRSGANSPAAHPPAANCPCPTRRKRSAHPAAGPNVISPGA